MSNPNWLPPSIALKDLETFLTRYDINSVTDRAHDEVLNALDILQIGLQSVRQAQEPLSNVQSHARRMQLAIGNGELENANGERKAALAACASLQEVVDIVAE